MPKISVMMPAYNAGCFIEEALDSILLQDFQDFQIVVSDDASTDGTARIIKNYQEKYPDKIIAIYNSTNVGVTANCNMALVHCTGEYVSLFAGDDVMLQGKFSQQVALMDAEPDCVLCYHPVEIFESSSEKILHVTNQHFRDDVHSTEDLLLKGGIPGGCSIMVRRNAIPDGGYDSRLKTVSDWLFFLEISTRGRVLKIDHVLARYRKHAGGESKRTYELLGESIRALDIFLENDAEREIYRNSINRAKARYIAGESVRQLANSGQNAINLAKTAISYERDNYKYITILLVAVLVRYVPGVKLFWRLVFNKLQYVLKRGFG